MTTTLCWVLVVLLFPLHLLLWATESRHTRIQRWHRQGWSQQRIADRLGVTRYAVRKALA